MTATVVLGGATYTGWKSVEVSRSMGEAAATFSLDVHDQWAVAPNWAPWPIHAGDPCQILLDGVLVVTGYVDDHQISYDADSHGQQISGRSKTGDLVDSSVMKKGGEWKDKTIDKILAPETQKFGVPLSLEGDPGAPFPKVRLQQGETPFELGDRLARMRGLTLTDSSAGALRLLSLVGGGAGGSLVEGENILAASATHRADQRHSEYIVKGQRPATDQAFGKQAAQIEAKAQDGNVKRYRPKLILAEQPGDKKDMRVRADQEAAKRAAESLEASVTVQGWQGPGGLWQAGQLVQLVSPMLAVNRTMVVRSITYRLSDATGTITEMQLAVPESLTTKPSGGAASQGVAPGGASGAQTDEIWTGTKPAKGAA